MRVMKEHRTSGQNLVEFALILPVLLLIIFIIIDLGRITYSYTALHNVAREGARYGIIHPVDTTDITNTALSYAVGLNMNELTVTPLYNGQTETITVTAIYNFRTVSPILSILTGDDVFTLTAVSRMNTEE